MKRHMRVVATMALFGAMFALPAFADEDANTKAFKALDTDGNGLLTMQEAEANVKVADGFADADANGDGILDMDEFAKMEISEE
jgi:Ca2+-binding EF-hand superfamily protein